MQERAIQHGSRDRQDFPDRIILTGFRAAGKTAVGRALARLTGFRFLDTDQDICEQMGCSIAEAVRQHGWPYFRERERAFLTELPAREKIIIATGGGAILHHKEWKELHQGAFAVWLRTDIATTLARLALDHKTAAQRPALTNKQQGGQNPAQEISALLEDREPLYRAGSDLVLDTMGKTPADLAGEIHAKLL